MGVSVNDKPHPIVVSGNFKNMNGKLLSANVRLLHTPSTNIKRDQQLGSVTILLAMIASSTVQSSTQTFIYNDILFTDTSNNARHNQVHWPIGMPNLSIIASNTP